MKDNNELNLPNEQEHSDDGLLKDENNKAFDDNEYEAQCQTRGDDTGDNAHSTSASVKKKSSKIGNVVSFCLIALLAVVLAFLIYGRAVYSNAYSISGSSMTVKWMEDGVEHSSLYTDGRIVYIDTDYELQRGKVYIIDHYQTENYPLIKRVVAIGGDKIWVDDGYICVLEKGKSIEESYKITQADGVNLERIDNAWLGCLLTATESTPLEIPEGFIFYVGDNRNGSTDCRAYGAKNSSLIRGEVKGFVPWWYVIVLNINGLESNG